jgi:hypothetical protein
VLKYVECKKEAFIFVVETLRNSKYYHSFPERYVELPSAVNLYFNPDKRETVSEIYVPKSKFQSMFLDVISLTNFGHTYITKMDSNSVSPMPELAPMAEFDKSPPSPPETPPLTTAMDDLPPPPTANIPMVESAQSAAEKKAKM